jgi:adenine-specific DNA-methyltransferase
MREMIENDLVYFGADEKSVPCAKRYLVDSEFEVPYSVFFQDGRGATKRLREFLGGEFFDFPKDEVVLQSIVEFASDKDSIIMDFFAGSGTTGHAVARQNEKDGGSRKYVLVTIDEPTSKNSFARAQGIESVSSITLMRLHRVAESFQSAKKQGLRVLRIAKSSFRREAAPQYELQLAAQTLAEGAVPRNIASELLLSTGASLSDAWRNEVIAGTEFIRVGLYLCAIQASISPEFIGQINSLGATHLLLLEDGFAGKDDLKSNLYFACKNAGVTMKTF